MYSGKHSETFFNVEVFTFYFYFFFLKINLAHRNLNTFIEVL